MNCLMEQIGKKSMNDECEERLIELQYFVARDFRCDFRFRPVTWEGEHVRESTLVFLPDGSTTLRIREERLKTRGGGSDQRG